MRPEVPAPPCSYDPVTPVTVQNAELLLGGECLEPDFKSRVGTAGYDFPTIITLWVRPAPNRIEDGWISDVRGAVPTARGRVDFA